jgi:hypothetical protein
MNLTPSDLIAALRAATPEERTEIRVLIGRLPRTWEPTNPPLPPWPEGERLNARPFNGDPTGVIPMGSCTSSKPIREVDPANLIGGFH